MRLVLFGPPMVGKGTQASMLARKFGLLHIAMGDLLRGAVSSGTSLGRKAKKFMDAGNLVPDAIVIGLLEGKLKTTEHEPGFILDGFPRTVDQAMQLEEFTDIDFVLCIEVPFDKLVERATGRRVCKSCGAIYHMKFNPPKNAEVCDRDGEKLFRRDDDKETVVRQRLQAYEGQTQPVINYYLSKNKFKFVDGDASIEEVSDRLIGIIKDQWPGAEILEIVDAEPAEKAASSTESKTQDKMGRATRRERGKGRRGGKKGKPKKHFGNSRLRGRKK